MPEADYKKTILERAAKRLKPADGEQNWEELDSRFGKS